MTKALTRLGELLKKEEIRLEMTCCGGIISLLYFKSRMMTQDVDVIFPDDPDDKNLLIQLIKQVGLEQNLSVNYKSLWFNDSVSFFGLKTRSENVIFKHPFLVLKAASWEELLAHKIHAFRHDKDIQDAVLLLKEMITTDEDQISIDKDRVYNKLEGYFPISPDVPEYLLKKRFDTIWKLTN